MDAITMGFLTLVAAGLVGMISTDVFTPTDVNRRG